MSPAGNPRPSGRGGGQWLGDPKTGKVLAVAMYPTEKQLHESADTVAVWKEELIPQAGGRLVSVDEYEVIAQEPDTGGS
jgi:cell division protein FtsI/penicillin-binding protein 2